MKENIRLSVIVTVFNRERYIARCLDSLLEQSVPEDEYEIVVIDDGSEDSSGDILDKYAERHKNIEVFHKENRGVAEARNSGLEKAKGNYITYVDSDDFVEKDCYKSLLEFAEDRNCDILICDYYKVYEDRKEYEITASFLQEGRISPQEYIRTTPSPCNKLMKKELFLRGGIRFPAGIYYEDYATIPLLANEAKIIYYKKTAFLNYFQENTSITRDQGYQKKWWDMYKASQNLNKLSPVFHDELEYIIYLYLLVRTSSWYLQCGRIHEVNQIADYYRKNFPGWRKNKYIKNRNVKEQITACLICQKAGKFLFWFMFIKKKVKTYAKKD